MTDPDQLLRLADPAPDIRAYDPHRRAALLDRAVTTPIPLLPQRRPRRTRAALAAGAAALVSSGGAAYAVLHHDPSDALQVACAVGESEAQFRAGQAVSTLISAASGDPVADCAAEYQRLEGTTPALRGYDPGQPFVVVVPSSWPVPSTWKALAPTFRSDPARLELSQRLDDQVQGPASGCFTTGDVEALVRRELADLGLTGWTVKRLEEADEVDGKSWCAAAFVDTESPTTVLLQGLERGGEGPREPSGDVRDVWDALRRDVAGECLTLTQAHHVTENAITAAGFSLADAKIVEVPDAGATCTRAYAPPAGLVIVILRGPTS